MVQDRTLQPHNFSRPSRYADPDHARQQAHHGVWSIARTPRARLLQACLLDLPDLVADQPSALHVATQLSQRVRRDRLALGRAQIFEAPGGLFQLGIEAAYETDQCRLHSVDDPILLSDEAFALAVGPLGIFVLGCRDRHHFAVITLAPQPAEKSAFEQLGVETVGFRSPMFARHRHTRGMNDVGVDAVRP